MISTTTTLYSSKQKIQDQTFDVDKLAEYALCFEVSEKDFYLLVVDTTIGKAVFLEHFVFSAVLLGKQLVEQLSLLFDDHHFLKAGFWKEIKFVVRNKKFVFIPNSLYEESKRASFLELNTEVDQSDVLITTSLKGLEAKCVFGIEYDLHNWVTHLYPSKEVVLAHGSEVLINAIHKSVSNKEGQEMIVSCDSHTLSIVVFKEGHLQYCNMFSYTNSEDMVYYIMLVLHELNLNPEVVPVILYGEVEQTSMHFAKLFKYVRFLSFGKRPKHIKFGFEFDECFEHQYFSVLSAYEQ